MSCSCAFRGRFSLQAILGLHSIFSSTAGKQQNVPHSLSPPLPSPPCSLFTDPSEDSASHSTQWRLYGLCWSLLALLHDREQAAAALEAGRGQLAGSMADIITAPVRRSSGYTPLTPRGSGGGGGSWGGHRSSGNDGDDEDDSWVHSRRRSAQMMEGAQCARLVARLLLFYAHKADVKALQFARCRFAVLAPLVFGQESTEVTRLAHFLLL